MSTQDTISTDDVFYLKKFKTDLNKKLFFGKKFKKKKATSNKEFIEQIFDKKLKIHHGVFQLNNWQSEYGSYIISFGEYKYQETHLITNDTIKNFIVIGTVLEPIDTLGNYRLNKICELSAGCGEKIEVESVFLANADKDKRDKELILLISDSCKKNGVMNNVFIYKKRIENNKLQLIKILEEHCDYTMITYKGEESDYYHGHKLEEGETITYIDCKLRKSDDIKKELKIQFD